MFQPFPPNKHTGNTTKILLMINSCVVYACAVCNRYAIFGLNESIFSFYGNWKFPV